MKNTRQEKLDHYKIGLSLDGGGMKGIIPATLMAQLTKETKKEIHQMFDCVGGTSIGGILALGSTGTIDGRTPVANANELVEFFDNYGSTIFNSSKID